MKKYLFIFIGSIILILLILVLTQQKQKSTTPNSNVDAGFYENETFGYTFMSPEGYEIKEYSPQFVEIGNSNGESFDSVASVTVLLSTDGEFSSFEDFLYTQSTILCAADGPQGSIMCTDEEQVQPFQTESGLSGIVFYLKKVEENFETNTRIESGFGPIFALNLGANVASSQYAALLIHPSITLPLDQVNSTLIRDIAETVTIDLVE